MIKDPIDENELDNETKEEEPERRLSFGYGALFGVFLTMVFVLVLSTILIHEGRLFLSTSESSLSAETIKKIAVVDGLIDRHYYGDINKQDYADGMLKGMVNALNDPYSEYWTAEEYRDNVVRVNRQYYGIGATLIQDPDTYLVDVVSVYDDSPAKRAGLQAGDRILTVNDMDVTKHDLDAVVDEIQGEEGSYVDITVDREGESAPLTFHIPREEINIPTVSYELLDKEAGIGYIMLMRFGGNTAVEFHDAVEDLEKQGMQALIIDLRYDGGGRFDTCISILDELLPLGVLVYTEDKFGNRSEETSDDENQLKLPMAVLINEETASASEIMAGAIRDFDWGTLIGTTTYGKGVVQNTYDLGDGSALKLTIEKYYTPSGESIHGRGISPDIELEYNFLGGEEDAYCYELDNQIQKAREVLTKELSQKQ